MKLGLQLAVILVIAFLATTTLAETVLYQGEGSADGDVAENTIDHDASGFENLYMSLRYGWQDDDEDHAKEKTAGSGESAP